MRSETRDGEVYVFWLTLRLCREIVGNFTKHLETTQMASTPARDNEHVQHSLHMKARSNLRPAKAVQKTGNDGLLVSKMKIRASKDRALLILPLTDSESAALPLTMEEARQWLGILYTQYQKAGWPLDQWPRWLRGDVALQAKNSSQSMH